MKNTQFLIAVLASVLLLQCQPYHYTPNSNNTPVFYQKGEKHLNANITLQTALESGEVQFAWSPVKHLGVMGNTFLLRNSIFAGANTTRILFGELGVGGQYIYKFGSDYEHTGLFVAFYTGGGLGNSYNDLRQQTAGAFGTPVAVRGSTDLNFRKFFAQCYMGFTNRNLEFGFSARRSMINFYNGSFYGGADYVITSFESLNKKSKWWVWEPAAFVSTGGRDLKYFLQIGGTTLKGNLAYTSCISTGLTWRFGGPPDMNDKPKEK